MPVPVLATHEWWRALIDRLGRQAAQTTYFVLAAIIASGGQIDLATTGIGLAGTLVVSLGKAGLMEFTQVQVTEGTALGWRLADRAVPAAAGVILGVWPSEWAGLLALDWGATSIAAAAAALLAVVSYWGCPPATESPAPEPHLSVGRTGRRRDRGDRGVVSAPLLAILIVVLIATISVVIAAAAAHGQARTVRMVTPVPHLEVTSASYCEGMITVRHTAEIPLRETDPIDGSRVTGDAHGMFQGSTEAVWAWTLRQPDQVTVELHHVGNGAGEGGAWDPVLGSQVHHQVEGEIAVRDIGKPTYDQVRVIAVIDGVGPIASSASLVTARCGS
jgi:hypothetical protein